MGNAGSYLNGCESSCSRGGPNKDALLGGKPPCHVHGSILADGHYLIQDGLIKGWDIQACMTGSLACQMLESAIPP